MPVQALWEVLLAAGEMLEENTPHITHDVTKASSVVPAWYLKPHQHVLEFFLLLLVLLPLAKVTGAGPWRVVHPVSPAAARDVPAAASSSSPSAATSTAVAAVLPDQARQLVLAPYRRFWRVLNVAVKPVVVGVFISTITYKALTDRLLYLLQPCHVLNMMLIYLVFNPGKPLKRGQPLDTPSVVFAVYLHSMYGGWLGLCMPDTRDLLMPGEVLSFFTQHVTLCFLPLLWLMEGRYNVTEPRVLYFWSLKFLYHVVVLLPASLAFAGNLNYMMVPPNGPLLIAGKLYRPVMGGVCIVLTVLMRLVLTKLTLWLCSKAPPPTPKKHE